MEILPPRRKGQLGAFSVGNGVPGSSGGFSIQSSARAPASGSKLSPQAVSEQVSVSQQSSRIAAGKTTPSGQADVFGTPAVVGVRPYAPAANTPAITLPAKQPDENLSVSRFANQIPQTPEQEIQKVLARDAGIAMPIKGGPATVVPPTGKLPPPSSTSTPKITNAVVKTAAAATGAQVGAKVAAQIATVKSLDAKRAEAQAKALREKKAQAERELAVLTAEKKAREAALAAARMDAETVRRSQTVPDDKKTEVEATLRSATEALALIETRATLTANTVKKLAAEESQAQDQAIVANSAAEAASADAESKGQLALQTTALAMRTENNAAAPDASKIAALPSDTLLALYTAGITGRGYADENAAKVQAAMPYLRAEIDRRGLPVPALKIIGPSVQNQKAGVPSWAMIGLGLVAVGALVYATRAKSLSGVPLVADLDEEEE